MHIIENETPELEWKLAKISSESAPLHTVQVGRETSQQLPGRFDELFHVLCETQNRLAAANSIPSLLDTICWTVLRAVKLSPCDVV